ncbi:MAG: hypothetical protein KY429_07615 [Actinobacteria bacterium]|nr:hypothetical protein [Actinomycetota bacterium]
MLRELNLLYPNVAPDLCQVTGTPQFDFHVRPEFVWSREKTAEHWSLPPHQRWILYTGNTFTHTPTEPELVGEIAAALKGKAWLDDASLVVRPHPLDRFDRWSAIAGTHSNILFRPPWQADVEWLTPTFEEDHIAWVNLVRHSSVCMNIGSSTTLDAAVVDTPIVLINFAAMGQREEAIYYRQFNLQREHYASIAQSPGVRVANSMEEMTKHLRAYLRDPAQDQRARRELAEEICGPLDGFSAVRVANALALGQSVEGRQ